MCVCISVCATALTWRSENNLQESSSYFHSFVARDGVDAIRLGTKHLYPVTHLTSLLNQTKPIQDSLFNVTQGNRHNNNHTVTISLLYWEVWNCEVTWESCGCSTREIHLFQNSSSGLEAATVMPTQLPRTLLSMASDPHWKWLLSF